MKNDKAFLLTVKHWDFEMIYATPTRGKAIAFALASAQDSDYNVKFTDFRAIRAPQFDELAQEQSGLNYAHRLLGSRWDQYSYGCLKREQPV